MDKAGTCNVPSASSWVEVAPARALHNIQVNTEAPIATILVLALMAPTPLSCLPPLVPCRNELCVGSSTFVQTYRRESTSIDPPDAGRANKPSGHLLSTETPQEHTTILVGALT